MHGVWLEGDPLFDPGFALACMPRPGLGKCSLGLGGGLSLSVLPGLLVSLGLGRLVLFGSLLGLGLGFGRGSQLLDNSAGSSIRQEAAEDAEGILGLRGAHSVSQGSVALEGLVQFAARTPINHSRNRGFAHE